MFTNRCQLAVQEGEGAVKAVDDGSLDMFGLTAQRLDERVRVKWSERLRQYFTFRNGSSLSDKARRANHDSGGPRLCTTARAVR